MTRYRLSPPRALLARVAFFALPFSAPPFSAPPFSALAGLALLAALTLSPVPAHAESGAVRIGIQPGMTYLALNVMNREKLLERRARDDGLDLKVEWIVSANGTVLNDGVLSGNIDIAGTGIPAFVTLWAKGRGTVDAKGIAAYGSLPGMLISRNPNVRSIEDFTSADRIAVPAPKASIQAILLEMMAEKTWVPGSMTGSGH